MKRFRMLLLTVLMAMMLMVPSVALAASSPKIPAMNKQTVTVKVGKQTFRKRVKKNGTVNLWKNAGYQKAFKIKVTKGATATSSNKDITLKKINATTWKVIAKKGAVVKGKITVTNDASKYTPVTFKLKQVTKK